MNGSSMKCENFYKKIWLSVFDESFALGWRLMLCLWAERKIVPAYLKVRPLKKCVSYDLGTEKVSLSNVTPDPWGAPPTKKVH